MLVNDKQTARSLSASRLTDRGLEAVRKSQAGIIDRATKAYKEFCQANEIEFDLFCEDSELVGAPGRALAEARKTKRIFDEEAEARTRAKISSAEMAPTKESWE